MGRGVVWLRGRIARSEILRSPSTYVVFVVGAVLRYLVLSSYSGDLNADEAYSGLQAMGVLDGRLPVVIDGNSYTAVIESYLFAPIVGLFGPHVVVLKLVASFFWGVAALLTYGAARRLMDRRGAGLAAALMWIAPGELLVVSTRIYVGYALGMACVVATLWAALVLADQDPPRRYHAIVFGFLAGFGFYVHPMFVTVLGPMVITTFVVVRRHLRVVVGPAAVAAFVANIPFLAWNALNGWPSLDDQNALPGTYGERLRAFVEQTIPRALGLRNWEWEWLLGRGGSMIAYALVAVAVVGGFVLIAIGDRTPGRFVVLVCAVAALPAMALFSQMIWSRDGRYAIIVFPLMCLAIGRLAHEGASVPPVAADVAHREVDDRGGPAPAVTVVARPISWRSVPWLGAVIVFIWISLYVRPLLDELRPTRIDDPNAVTTTIVDRLEQSDVRFVAGSYWVVLPVEYVTDRAIQGAVTAPYPVRFPERQRLVQAQDPYDVVFIFAVWDDTPARLWLPAESYAREEVYGAVLYFPIRPAG